MTTPKIQAQLRRLRVFNAAKAFMQLHNRAPDVPELEDFLPGVQRHSIRYHLHELDGAAGLPFATVTGRTSAIVRRDAGDYTGGDISHVPSADEFMRELPNGHVRLGVTRKELFGSIDL
jgi:hypothetical protein